MLLEFTPSRMLFGRGGTFSKSPFIETFCKIIWNKTRPSWERESFSPKFSNSKEGIEGIEIDLPFERTA
jgi:hypothetical protein